MWTEKKTANVGGADMAYVERGSGATTFVFLHGNPTSSFVWRDVLPHLEDLGRCLAPDLMGMGDSDKLTHGGPGRYSVSEHLKYLDAFADSQDVGDQVVLVLHDWGTALGFDWARRHPDQVSGIVHMESLAAPLESEDDLGPRQTAALLRNRTDEGERLTLEDNVLVERFLPAFVLRELSDEEVAEYRRPFEERGESRRVILTLNRQVPFQGQPADVDRMMRAYGSWLRRSPVPKLLIRAEPGFILTGRILEVARSWPNTTEAQVRGSHFLQEDSGDEIGRLTSRWFRDHVQVS